jgi:hypothetical protein
MNPYRKLPFLTRLWQQVPDPQATSYYNDCNKRLRELWEKDYKEREIEDENDPPSLVDVIKYRDYTSLRMQYRNSLGDNDSPQNTGRRRQRRAAAQVEDELDRVAHLPDKTISHPTNLHISSAKWINIA